VKPKYYRGLLLTAFFMLLALAVACGGAAPTSAPAATSAPASTGAPAATAAPQSSGAPEVINAYFDDDTNITDWMSNKIIPAFQKQFPQYQVKVVIVRGIGNGNSDIADRADAALKSGADPQSDIIGIDALSRPNTIQDNLWLKLDDTNVPNSKNLVKGIKTSDWSMPYRGSQVLLAYDSSKIKDADVPHTFADLISWVKANPGQFVYCRPDKGGSGSNFVVRAIYEVTGKDPTIFKAGDPDPALVAQFPKAWDLLRSIHTDIYQNGAYPAGNTQVLTLVANGSVSMATVWSDQALQGLAKGVLPPNIKLAQLTDLPFPGGDAYFSIPKNSKHTKAAVTFLNYLLGNDTQVSVVKDIGGFPAVDWSNLPSDLQQQYNSVIAKSVPNWPGGKWGAELNKGWYDNVATNIKQGS
jgi:putative spermidine/putrescine transport system substrate-binding protein